MNPVQNQRQTLELMLKQCIARFNKLPLEATK